MISLDPRQIHEFQQPLCYFSGTIFSCLGSRCMLLWSPPHPRTFPPTRQDKKKYIFHFRLYQNEAVTWAFLPNPNGTPRSFMIVVHNSWRQSTPGRSRKASSQPLTTRPSYIEAEKPEDRLPSKVQKEAGLARMIANAF